MSRQMQKIVDSNFHQTTDNQVIAHTFSQIKRSLNVKVRNCAGNAHSYTVSFGICLKNTMLTNLFD